MTTFILHRLPEQGRTLVADQDYLLAQVGPAQLLLIHLPPGAYAYERHARAEYLLCLRGRLVLEAEGGEQVCAAEGEMVEVCPGVVHRFAPSVDAVIFTVAQTAAV